MDNLPDRCVCGYQGKIDRLEAEIERLRELLNNVLEREKKDNLRQLEIVRKVEADRDRWRDLAEYLCRTVPSVVVPNEIASRFPDPLAVRGE